MSDAPTPPKGKDEPAAARNERDKERINPNRERPEKPGQDAGRGDTADARRNPNREAPEGAPDQAAERARVAHPKDGIGFKHDSVAVDAGAVTDHLKGYSTDVLTAVREGRATMTVEARASRDGTAEHNQHLTDGRAVNTRDELARQLGIEPSSILTNSVGEGDAVSKNKPDGRDDADDRVAIIKVQMNAPERHDDPEPEGDVDDAVKNAEDALPKTRLDDHAAEQGGMLADRAKKFAQDTLKEAAKNPELIEEIAVKNAVKQAAGLAKDEAVWMVRNLAKDMGDKKLQTQIMANALPGMQDALADFAGVRHHDHKHQQPDFRGERSALYRLARDTYRENLERRPPEAQQNIRDVMRSNQRGRFEQLMGDRMLRYGGRGTRQ